MSILISLLNQQQKSTHKGYQPGDVKAAISYMPLTNSNSTSEQAHRIYLPEPNSSKLPSATWQWSDSDVDSGLILFNPFSLQITSITDRQLPWVICLSWRATPSRSIHWWWLCFCTTDTRQFRGWSKPTGIIVTMGLDWVVVKWIGWRVVHPCRTVEVAG